MKKTASILFLSAVTGCLFTGCAGLIPVESDLSYLLFTSPQEYRGKKVNVYLDDNTYFGAKVNKPVTVNQAKTSTSQNNRQSGVNNAAANTNTTVVGNNNTVVNNTTIINNNNSGGNGNRQQAGTGKGDSNNRRSNSTGVRSNDRTTTRASGKHYGVTSGSRKVTVKNDEGKIIYNEKVQLEKNSTRTIKLP